MEIKRGVSNMNPCLPLTLSQSKQVNPLPYSPLLHMRLGFEEFKGLQGSEFEFEACGAAVQSRILGGSGRLSK